MESISSMSESGAVMGMGDAASRDGIEVIDEVAVAEVDQSNDVVVASAAATMDTSDDGEDDVDDDDDDDEDEDDDDDDEDDDDDDDDEDDGEGDAAS